jgi:hypothetical protein
MIRRRPLDRYPDSAGSGRRNLPSPRPFPLAWTSRGYAGEYRAAALRAIVTGSTGGLAIRLLA